MAKFHYLLTGVADEGVVALDGFPVDSWRAIRAMKEVGLLVREGGDKGGLLDDVLQDAGRAAVFAGRVREARRGRVRDYQVGAADGRRVQDAGVVSEDARRSAKVMV